MKMLWTLEKLEQRVLELETYRYRELQELNGWAYMEDKEKAIGVYPPTLAAERMMDQGDRWQGRDLYVWLNRKVKIPAEWSDKKVCGLFDFGKTGHGNNEGFESLLFVNGKPFQGVDANHKEVFLPKELAGAEVDLTFRLWSGLEGGGVQRIQEQRMKQAALAYLDEHTDHLYYSARAIIETVKLFPDEQLERHELLRALDRSLLQLDWSYPGSDAFYQSVQQAATELDEQLQQLKREHPVTVRCIGHTHIDVAWLWRLAHTREKAARSFSTVLRLMELYPEYIFLQTQPQLYEYMKEDYPEIYEQIKARIAEGRWEAGGAMWLEADCNLPSGESLVRQILYGTAFFRNEFGTECKYLWLPDVFGYSWALPQILRKSGIETMMTTKISWNQYNRMPHDTFQWRGIDGTEILTHFITTPDDPTSTSWFYTYNGKTEPYAIKGIWDVYRDKGLNQELLLSYGYSDGGGGVNRDMLETRRRMEQMPGMPSAVTGRADEYFEKLQETVANTDQYVHTWDGELYLEFHRGTYTSQAYSKKMNRKLELLYREAEWMGVLQAAQSGVWQAYPAADLAEGWKIILRNQFHDIIPGSSIKEVYEDSKIEYEQAHQLGLTAISEAERLLQLDRSNTVTIYNSASYERSDIAVIERLGDATLKSESHYAWFDEDGNKLSAQKSGNTWMVYVTEIPSMGSCLLSYQEVATVVVEGGEELERGGSRQSGQSDQTLFEKQENGIHTPFYDIAWNEAGQLVSIYDKEAGRQVLADGECGNVLQIFEDKPKMFDAWDIDIFYQQKKREVTELQSVEWKEAGPLYAVIGFKWSYMNSTIEQELKVYAHNRKIDFITKVDWQERQQLLKAAFPISVRSPEATYDIQFGNVKRPTHWNTSWDYARFETVGHQWADLSERGYGVSLLNDCKYGYDIKDHVMRLSLLKSAIYPDTEADRGMHEFTYSLLPHTDGWFEAETVKEAWSLNNPLRAVNGEAACIGKSMFRISKDHMMIDAVKKAEDSDAIIVRLHEFGGARGEAMLESDYEIADWQETDLLERAIAEKQSGSELRFEIKPYEIKTFIITLK